MEIQIKEKDFQVIVKINNGDSFHDIKNFLETAFSEEEVGSESFPISVEVYDEGEGEKIEEKSSIRDNKLPTSFKEWLDAWSFEDKHPTMPNTTKTTDIKEENENDNTYPKRFTSIFGTYVIASPNVY